MIRSNYEDTIFVITNKLNDKLEHILEQSNCKSNISFDNDVIEFAKITAEYNNIVLKLIDRNTMIKEFVSERNSN